jgi:Holliday junction resolvase YEN1
MLTVCSIYGEIGPGERIALSKLAVESIEQNRRPLRIAIDVSIWQFQIQAGRGGSNPAHRTFYYRLLRLLSISVQPLFVFDGPNKPKFKRGQRSGHAGASLSNQICKQLLRLFGFPFHMAPGEAEAECALLQREGIVDAVMSEDVDTLMFGCGVTLRNWSAEGKAKIPTHVNIYKSMATKQGKSGLDREGMILVALMSGGDYIMEGIPGVGIKVACEAARAGYGKSLCQISRLDSTALDSWRENLSYELQTNEKKFFRRKHKALILPDTFPDPEVLGYYTHPIVSTASKVEKLKNEISWDGEPDITGLRAFVAEAFEWTHKTGAKKFIRGLAPVLLVHKLRLRGDRRESGYGDIVLTQLNEMALVKTICGKRTHTSTDGLPELRVTYYPNDIVGLDLDAEEDDGEDYGRDGLAPRNDDDEIEAYISDERSASPSKKGISTYDPTQADRIWIAETIARLGIPLKVEDYEESLRNPKKATKSKSTSKKAGALEVPKTKGGMPKGALDKFVKVSKAVVEDEDLETTKSSGKSRAASDEPSVPPIFLAASLRSITPERTTLLKSQFPEFKSSALEASPSSKTAPATTKLPERPKKLTKLPINPPYSKPDSFLIPSLTPTAKLITMPQKHVRSPGSLSNSEAEHLILISPTSRVNEDLLLVTSTSSMKDIPALSFGDKSSPESQSFEAPFITPEPVNRILNFPASRHESSSPDLPPLIDLVLSSPKYQVKHRLAEREVIDLLSSPEGLKERSNSMSPRRRAKPKPAKTENVVTKKKNFIMLRESLPGTWKEVDEDEAANSRGKAFRYSQVEILDLTDEP